MTPPGAEHASGLGRYARLDYGRVIVITCAVCPDYRAGPYTDRVKAIDEAARHDLEAHDSVRLHKGPRRLLT